MKQKKEKGKNHKMTAIKKQHAGVKKNRSGKNKNSSGRNQKGEAPSFSPATISMKGTQKVTRDTVIHLCSQAIKKCDQSNRRNRKGRKQKKKGSEELKKEKKLKKVGKMPEVMNYKVLKNKRKEEAEMEAAMKAAADADKERVSAKEGPQKITAKMIKAAKEKDAHKQGILHLWGRPGSGAFKQKRKRGGKR